MNISASIYWYDYETSGADPRRDRPVQFAGLRTDLDLKISGDPLCIYCRPADDFLPQPDACLVTRITPQKALAEGIPEAEFIGLIHKEFARPNTCVAGYNNIRFDDEVTRFSLYRNFFDPYAREWQNGNSRWDIIDMVRLTYALRPEGIEWPRHPDGRPSFRLEDLTRANGITHQAAHDALSDVRATIAMAALIRERQPRLYDYVFQHRCKHQVAQLLDTVRMTPVLHVSSMYPAELGCIALVAPVAVHPNNKNEIIAYDLRHDPAPFLDLPADELRTRLFSPANDLPEGVTRLPIKTIHINKSPVVVPANTLTPEAAQQWEIDPPMAARYLQTIQKHPHFLSAVTTVYKESRFEPIHDPDLMLYSGGFFSDADRRRMQQIREAPIEQLGQLDLPFEDRRLSEMLFRYRARNYPQTLTTEECLRWEEFRHQRLLDPHAGASITDEVFLARIKELRDGGRLTAEEKNILDELEKYRARLMR
jgi:exodeoxyribonuclease-1